MAWMNVHIYIDRNNSPVPNVVNIDAIVRYGPNETGSYIKFLDGTSVDVVDPVHEITKVILQTLERAQEK